MKQVIESYSAIFIVLILFLMGMSFTTISMNVTQARKIFNDIRSEVQASNGAIVDNTDRYYYNSTDSSNAYVYKLSTTGYQYEYSIVRQSIVGNSAQSDDETYIYNDLYKISLKYEYYVPLFGRQIYPMTGFAY